MCISNTSSISVWVFTLECAYSGQINTEKLIRSANFKGLNYVL